MTPHPIGATTVDSSMDAGLPSIHSAPNRIPPPVSRWRSSPWAFHIVLGTVSTLVFITLGHVIFFAFGGVGGPSSLWAIAHIAFQTCFQVEDDAPAASSVRRGFGIGLANTRSRLEAIYGAGQRFELLRADAGTIARLRLPLAGDALAIEGTERLAA